MSIDKQDVKLLAAAIASAAAAWGGAQATAPSVDNKGVTRAEVEKLIDTYGPYNRDKEYIQTQLGTNRGQLLSISKDLIALRIQQARLETKIDALLKRKR